jgi:hypothetical protein
MRKSYSYLIKKVVKNASYTELTLKSVSIDVIQTPNIYSYEI